MKIKVQLAALFYIYIMLKIGDYILKVRILRTDINVLKYNRNF